MPGRKKRVLKKNTPRRKPGAAGSGKRKRGAASRSRRRGYRWSTRLLALLLLFGLVGAVYLLYLDHRVRATFEGKRWAVPAQVYGRPLELYVGAAIGIEQLTAELKHLGYRQVSHPHKAASWSRNRGRFLIRSRPFRFWDGSEPSRLLDLRIDDNHVIQLLDGEGRELPLVRLEAPSIGTLYPAHNEDRVLVTRQQLPELLVAALLAVEDREFFTHHGVNPKSILRALWANIRAGEVVQGGSTLTQQLVKNLYLSRERTLSRKINEALMALMLDARYDKDEILTAYANEIYLGQQGDRAIHGFALASRFYFNRPLGELELPQLALLAGMIRGPSLYDPRRHPERARERRDLVLGLMAAQGAISDAQRAQAQQAQLQVGRRSEGAETRYPAFLSLVKRQLIRDYREEDLTSEGLRIFTTLDPWVQERAEAALAGRLARLDRQARLPAGTLEGAVVVAAGSSGEVQALVSGREPGYAGFNRALDAVRPIGSLIKPVVYLAALAQPRRFTLATLLEDEPVSLEVAGGKEWTPQNYDHQAHGAVPLYQALAYSYNLATVRLGLELGVGRVTRMLRDLGVEREVEEVPALLLGAVALSPLEVAQIYQTVSANGFHTPLRAIREVQSSGGEALQRYPLTVRQVVDQGAAYLLTRALQEVVRSGTGRRLAGVLPSERQAAGKTGTTDELRDSWFAGFDGDRVAVVWVGRDDNSPAGLTGAAGALPVWGDLMAPLDGRAPQLPPGNAVEWAWVDPASGLRADAQCSGAVELPFLPGSAPQTRSGCVQGPAGGLGDFFRGFFQ
ncbi:MAG: penicillin-binding protein 1B [Gammaproteobacteria bacterium]|nr:penicillin-binding protein 1B [Gammaproteobacteria bacterium]